MGAQLAQASVWRVPCYTFHDPFQRLANGDGRAGLLDERRLDRNCAEAEGVDRLRQAVRGWVRYVPLLVHLSRPDEAAEVLREMDVALAALATRLRALPPWDVIELAAQDFRRYAAAATKDMRELALAKEAWVEVMCRLERAPAAVGRG